MRFAPIRRRRWVLATIVGVVMALPTTAAAVVPIEPVVTGAGDQWLAYANDQYLVYTQWQRATPNNFVALAKPLAAGPLTRINPEGTRGFTGGIDPGTNRVIYEEWTRGRGGKLYFYDLDTDQRTKVAGVDAPGTEWRPVISSRFIMFTRERFVNGDWYDSVHVYERATGAIRKLGTWKWGPNIVYPGSVGERYAAYTLCNRTTCRAYLYDWDMKVLRRVPTVNDRAQYAPVVAETNAMIYFTRSSNEPCGIGVGIWRMPLDLTGTAVRLVALPRGVDTDWSSSVAMDTSSGTMDLYFMRYDCDRETGDVFAARDVNV